MHCSACGGVYQAVIQPGAHPGGAQVCNIRGDRGRAEAAHLLSMLQGALLRAALSAGVLGCPPKGMQAVAGACGLGTPRAGALLGLCISAKIAACGVGL